jgi:hypothetical protein
MTMTMTMTKTSRATTKTTKTPQGWGDTRPAALGAAGRDAL